jgi:hypothetical protein
VLACLDDPMGFENLHGDHCELTTTKNRKSIRIRIPIYPAVACIWKPYEGNLPKIDKPTLVVDHRGAERIEETVSKWKRIEAHSGKRSFITNLLLAGVSIESLREITGNTSDMIKAYIVPTGEEVQWEFTAACLVVSNLKS